MIFATKERICCDFWDKCAYFVIFATKMHLCCDFHDNNCVFGISGSNSSVSQGWPLYTLSNPPKNSWQGSLDKYFLSTHRSYNKYTNMVMPVYKPEKEKLECPSCQKLFEVRWTLLSHIKQAHKEKTLPCDQCDQTFSNKVTLTRHHERKHIKSRNFPCSQCEKKFHDIYDVRTHTDQVHSKLEPYQCDVCPSKFKRNSGWRNHRQIHVESKDFDCAVCLKKFKHKANAVNCLKRHNSPECVEFPCNNCGAVLQTEDGRR